MKPHLSHSGSLWIAECPLGMGVGQSIIEAWMAMVGAVSSSPSVMGMFGDPFDPATWRFAVMRA